MFLCEAEPGKKVIIKQINDKHLKELLHAQGLFVGSEVKILGFKTKLSPVLIQYETMKLFIRRKDARVILIES
jgi:Fe2+ transport system protein FeoA